VGKSLTIAFHVYDKSSGRQLDGQLVFCMYQSCWAVPIVEGRCEIVSSGAFTGAKRRYVVFVDGYVPSEGYFFQHDGLSFEVPLAKYWWFEEPVSPEEPTPPPTSALLPVIAIGGLALLTR